MFAPDLSRFPFGRKLVEAALRGPQDVVREARRARRGVEDEEADAFGVELAQLFYLNIDPPGRVGSLVCAAQVFGGPQTLAVVGDALRGDRLAMWKIERGLEILKAHRGPEAIVQLTLCGRDAWDVHVLEGSRAEVRGYPGATAALLEHATADAPLHDLTRYLELGLERAMIEGTRFRLDQLTAALQTPVRNVLSGIVWGAYDSRRPTHVFVIDPDEDAFIDRNFARVRVPDDTRVAVAHPAEFTAPFREEWGLFLGDFEISAPFPQFDRECQTAEIEFEYLDINTEVKHWDLVRFLFARGWTRRPRYPDFEFPIRGTSLRLNTHLLADEETRCLESIILGQHLARGLENDVIYTEALNESMVVLEEFAPHVLYH